MDARRIKSAEELLEYISSMPGADPNLSTGGTTSSQEGTIGSLLTTLNNYKPTTTPGDEPLKVSPPPPPATASGRMLWEPSVIWTPTSEQATARVVKRTPIVVPPIVTPMASDRFMSNSDGTCFKDPAWLSKNPAKPNTCPLGILNSYPPSEAIDPFSRIATMGSDLRSDYYDTNVLNPWQVVGTFDNSNAYKNDIDFVDGRAVLATDYNQEYCSIFIPTWLQAFYKEVKLKFYLTDFEGVRSAARIPNAYSAMCGSDYYIDSYGDIFTNPMSGWSIEGDECVFTKSLRMHNIDTFWDASCGRLLTLTSPRLNQFTGKYYAAGQYVYDEADVPVAITAEMLYITGNCGVAMVNSGRSNCINFTFHKLQQFGIINITGVEFVGLLL